MEIALYVIAGLIALFILIRLTLAYLFPSDT